MHPEGDPNLRYIQSKHWTSNRIKNVPSIDGAPAARIHGVRFVHEDRSQPITLEEYWRQRRKEDLCYACQETIEGAPVLVDMDGEHIRLCAECASEGDDE